MSHAHLSETVEIKTVNETEKIGTFVVSGLYPGYGLTVGNAIRRTLLSSLPGGAITYVKIKDVDHEFSTVPGVIEDVVEMTLNLKKLRFEVFSDEPQVLTLKMKGEKEATAGDIKANSEVRVVNPEAHIATLTTKSAELEMELTVEKGLGYSPAEARKDEKLSVGVIAVDSFFSPVVRVNYTIENIRVGDRTDYNQVTFVIETDGTIKPGVAFHKAANILKDHFAKIGDLSSAKEEGGVVEEPVEAEEEPASKKK